MENLNIEKVNSMISRYEDSFHQALAKSARMSLLASIKSNLDYWRGLRNDIASKHTSNRRIGSVI